MDEYKQQAELVIGFRNAKKNSFLYSTNRLKVTRENSFPN